MKSINTLVIKNVTLIPENWEYVVKMKCIIEVELQFRCPITGYTFFILSIVCENTGYSSDDALKAALQDFLDGRFALDYQIHDKPSKCTIHYGINHMDKFGHEPLDTLFSQVFSNSSWTAPVDQKQLNYNNPPPHATTKRSKADRNGRSGEERNSRR